MTRPNADTRAKTAITRHVMHHHFHDPDHREFGWVIALCGDLLDCRPRGHGEHSPDDHVVALEDSFVDRYVDYCTKLGNLYCDRCLVMLKAGDRTQRQG